MCHQRRHSYFAPGQSAKSFFTARHKFEHVLNASVSLPLERTRYTSCLLQPAPLHFHKRRRRRCLILPMPQLDQTLRGWSSARSQTPVRLTTLHTMVLRSHRKLSDRTLKSNVDAMVHPRHLISLGHFRSSTCLKNSLQRFLQGRSKGTRALACLRVHYSSSLILTRALS